MGFMSSKKYKLSGLIFDSKEDYFKFKNIDKNINEIVKKVNNGVIDIKDVFKDIKNIKVKECYYDACDEMNETFYNAAKLLMYEGTNEYEIGCKFFDKINIIEFDTTDD